MEVLRHLRPIRRLTFALAALAVAAAPADAQRTRGQALAAPTQQWPVKTREHVDLWLHAFALLQEDTASVPIFARGYAERMTILKNSRGVYTGFDQQRSALLTDPVTAKHLLNAQFLPLYFENWQEMKQAFEFFLRAEGDPRRANNRDVQGIVYFLSQTFPRAEDRTWVRKFVDAVQAEYDGFYRAWWLEEFRAREAALATADSLWHSTWRPALQRFLGYTRQTSGDLILTFTLGGEGRALAAGARTNQFAIAFPPSPDSAEVLLFTFAHEAAGAMAKVAVDDNLTPAQQRQGLGNTYLSHGLVRGGALLVEHAVPGAGERYARWYLAQAGKPVPDGDALAALAEAFPMPDAMVDEMRRQIRLSSQGI
ncbi:MAG: hypothetical protein KF689_12620 [Gemmatimonadaceae bacterium]|nr:hypothetical protein [Gemmatimonadaceae bacterium]MCW5827174.1 hypothetical protein [Gemmatimonadaceae bacterium]